MDQPVRVLIACLLSLCLIAGAAVPTVLAQDDSEETDDERDSEEAGSEETDSDEADSAETDAEETDAEETDAEERDDDERDDDERDERDEVERSVRVETDDEGVTITLEQEGNGTEDQLEMRFRTDDASFTTEYEWETDQEELELELEVLFSTLAEFRDADGDGAYDDGEEIVSSWALADDDTELDGAPALDALGDQRNVDWGTPTVADIATDGKNGKTIVVPATFDGEGAFTLRFHVFGDFVDFQGEDLRPTSVKVDIQIDDYPYAANDTRLALFMATETKAEHELDDDVDDIEGVDDDERGVAANTTAGDLDLALVFTWKGNATVDGADTTVDSTTLSMKDESEQEDGESEQKSSRTFALSYARGDRIVHDPEVFLLATQATEEVEAPALGLIGGLAAVLAGLAVATRRRRA